MLATLLVIGSCLYLIGLRADRIHAGRAVTEPDVALSDVNRSLRGGDVGRGRDTDGERTQLAPRSLNVSGSVTTYRGLTASQWAARFRDRTDQLQAALNRARRARRALAASLQFPVYGLDPLERAFMCIHGFEGSWTDSGAPFWGGLQMDSSFMTTYGGWALRAFGTADHWPISVQLAVAIRAKVSGRGFYPWPNTARYCGLIE